MTSLWTTATRLFGQLCRALVEHGEVTIKVADLAGRQGLTDFRTGTIFIDHLHAVAGARAAIGHELEHLIGGPVTPACAGVEEVRVRRATARILVPDAARWRQLHRPLTRAELDVLAEDYEVDCHTARDAIALQARPAPRQRLAAEGAA